MAVLRLLVKIINFTSSNDDDAWTMEGYGLEKDMHVQGHSLEEIKEKVYGLLHSYTSSGVIDFIPSADREIFDEWNDLDTVAYRITVNY
jgi:hypothetical protein